MSDLFKDDPEGKIYFSNYLKEKGFEILDFGSQYSCYDIKGRYKDEIYFFELKNRTIDSNLYGDSIIEKTKYDLLQNLEGKVFVINFFTDCFHIHNLNSCHEEQYRYARKTTNWDRTKIHKTFISYPNTQRSQRLYS